MCCCTPATAGCSPPSPIAVRAGSVSAVGEMGEKIGAEVWLERAPLKYEGLSYTEIWISEAQERMVVSVPQDNWDELERLCGAEGVEATIIGQFEPTERLVLKYHGERGGRPAYEILHDGRPPVVREATYTPPATAPLELPSRSDYTGDLLKILGSLNVASKHWIIRQYDHEVQGRQRGQAAGRRAQRRPQRRRGGPPRAHQSTRAIVIACGMNPHYGDLDHLPHGRQRDRRGDSQLRRRRRRPRADRDSRQLLLGRLRETRDAWLAGPGGRLPVTICRSPWGRRSSAARTA